MAFDQIGKYRHDLFDRHMIHALYSPKEEMVPHDDFEKEYIRLQKLPLTEEERARVILVIGVNRPQ